MVAAGQDLTPGDTYGSALIKCGQTQLKLGQVEREYATRAETEFIKPLKEFLDDEAKALVVSNNQQDASLYAALYSAIFRSPIQLIITLTTTNITHLLSSKREKRVLEVKRLDLDSAKSKVKRVKSTEHQQKSNVRFDQSLSHLFYLTSILNY